MKVLEKESFPEWTLLRAYPKIFALIGIIHTFLCAGVVFGWASLYAILKYEGIFSTDPSTATQKFSNVFMFGAIGNYMSNLPFGTLLDSHGPKITCIAASLLFTIGLYLCSLAVSDESGWYLTIGYGLLGLAGPAIQLPTLHLSKLFPDNSAALMSIQAAAFDGGCAVFAIAKSLKSSCDLSSQTFFRLYLIVPAFTLLTALIAWPHKSLPNTDEFNSIDDLKGLTSNSSRDSVTSISGAGSPFYSPATKSYKRKKKMHNMNLIDTLQTKEFIFLALFTSIHILKLNFVVTSINDQLDNAFDSNTTVDTLIGLFGFLLPLGFVIMPLTAYLLQNDPIWAFQLANILGCIYGIALLVGDLSPLLHVLIIFPLVAVSRQLVYSTVFNEIDDLFGFKNYGTLLGIVNVVVSAVGCIQALLVTWAVDIGNWHSSNLSLVLVTLPLFAAPMVLSEALQPKSVMEAKSKIKELNNTERTRLLKVRSVSHENLI